MSAIEEMFRELRRTHERALIAYVMAGDPTPKRTVDIVGALVAGGADIIELGIPFSDPIADGPTLQRASERALRAGTTPGHVFGIARAIKRLHDIPVVVMTYYNIIYRMGIEAFCATAEQSGVSGIIAPDLPVEEASLYKDRATPHGLDTIFLAAPSTSAPRLETLLSISSGFLYLVSANGVTGARETVQDESVAFVRRTASIARGRMPIAVGFGLSLPSHIGLVVSCGADGAVIGSKFSQIVEQNLDRRNAMLTKLRHCSQALKNATRLSAN